MCHCLSCRCYANKCHRLLNRVFAPWHCCELPSAPHARLQPTEQTTSKYFCRVWSVLKWAGISHGVCKSAAGMAAAFLTWAIDQDGSAWHGACRHGRDRWSRCAAIRASRCLHMSHACVALSQHAAGSECLMRHSLPRKTPQEGRQDVCGGN
jgi:hypothetical protein